jgi:arylsulfatase A-like enzyme
VVTQFTENVDLLPTLADALSLDEPVQCDGRSLAPLFADRAAPWRSAAHYEWDYREYFIASRRADWPRDRTLSRQNLAVSLSDEFGYVQFADGSFKCYDLVEDPTWRSECRDAERIIHAAQEQLVWRQEHLRRELTDMLLRPSRPGRWPAGFSTNRVGSTSL